MKYLISLFENADRAGEVLEQNKLQMHKDEVFCFTPNGDIFNLPLGVNLYPAIFKRIRNYRLWENCLLRQWGWILGLKFKPDK